MRASRKIKPENLKRLCGLKGLTIPELAERIDRHVKSVHRAVKHPQQHKPTFRKIEEVLCA